MNFNSQYQAALERQAVRQERKISPVNQRVADLVAVTANKAMQNTRSGNSASKFNVVSAPTGSSKTQSAVAYAITKYLIDPEFTCAFIVEEIKQAQEIYVELLKEISPNDLGVWTSYHDVVKSDVADHDKYGFTPELTTQEAVKNKRVAIYTHNRWHFETADDKDLGVRKHKGKLRDVLFIDEQPASVQILEKTPADILKLRDWLVNVPDAERYLQPLVDISRRMDALLASKGSDLEAVDLVSCLEIVNEFEDQDAIVLASGFMNFAKVLEGFQFIRACARGYCFISRNNPRTFVGYLPTFEVAPNQVILDATADISGVYPLLGGVLVEGMPNIDYSNLKINHIDPPSEFKIINKVIKNRAVAVKYGDWIKQVVEANTKVGDKVLVITHKAMFQQLGVLPYCPTKPDTKTFNGRVVNLISWGQGIGSNKFKDCTEVFMFSEFYKPKRVTIAETLGAKRSLAKSSNIHKRNGGLDGEFKTMQEGDLLRWDKQLASRGNIRNVDQQGKCGVMNLHTTMDFNRLLANIERLFPNAEPLSRNLEYSKDETESSKRKRLVDLLSSTKETKLSFREIGKHISKASNEINRELNAETVKPAMEYYSWSVVSSKDIGEQGKGKWLVKKDVFPQ